MKKKYTIVFITLFLTVRAFGVTVGFDADDFSDYENIHTPVPEMTLWRSTYQYKFDKLYSNVFAAPSSDPAKPLGERVIGNSSPLSPQGLEDYWGYEPCLYITINGLAKEIIISTANHPNWIRKTFTVDCFDIDGVQVAHNFKNIGSRLSTDVGEYTISSVVIYTTGIMSIDDIEIDYIVPEPSTMALLLLGLPVLWRKYR